jgi:NADH-quinone oxidoreductase subunit D
VLRRRAASASPRTACGWGRGAWTWAARLGGGATIFLYAIRERELILDLFEALTGARLLYGFHQVGGVRYDLPAGWTEQCRQTLNLIEQRLHRVRGDARGQPVLPRAHAGVGVISRELALDVGVCGPLIRGSGIDYDVRRAEPYSSYGSSPSRSGGDGRRLLRALSRADGGVPRVDRHRAPVLDGLPEGPISSRPA